MRVVPCRFSRRKLGPALDEVRRSTQVIHQLGEAFIVTPANAGGMLLDLMICRVSLRTWKGSRVKREAASEGLSHYWSVSVCVDCCPLWVVTRGMPWLGLDQLPN